jgi:hypothetical protein
MHPPKEKHSKMAAMTPVVIMAFAVPLAMLLWLGNMAFSFFTSGHDHGKSRSGCQDTKDSLNAMTLVCNRFGDISNPMASCHADTHYHCSLGTQETKPQLFWSCSWLVLLLEHPQSMQTL